MKQQIIKSEILWSRVCPLKCSYCAMADGRRNTVSLQDWQRGLVQLQNLGCSFLAFYGAEPLADFDKLPEVIFAAEYVGMHTTVITSGFVSDLYEKLETLYEHGLRSITTSYDDISQDVSSQKKTSKALEVIKTFRSFGPVRDSAVVVTLTRENFRRLPDIILEMTAKKIWTFFDIIHPDRGQPGSKVKDTDYDLLFRTEDYVPLVETLKRVAFLKANGYLCHTSNQFIETMKIVGAYMLRGNYPPDHAYIWHCSDYAHFPSWVTVDCDGTVYPCDDFQPKDQTMIKVWEIYQSWAKFCSLWKDVVDKQCPGCLWNTHIDCHLVKTGVIPLTNYVHGLDEQ
jgi:MoaA/NifB/PqqE/SkfB family radical SAM enzyme